MNINLLAESVVLLLSIILTTLLTFLISHLGRKTQRKKLLISFISALIISLLLQLIFHLKFSTDKLPWTLWLMFFPLVLTLCLVPIFWRGTKKLKRLKWLSIAGILPGLLFSLVLINNYYRLYPTLYSLLNIETRQQALATQNATYLQFGNTSHAKFDKLSIEASLYGQDTADTRGSIQQITIPGEQSKFKARSGYVYIPKIANSPAKLNLPVIILLPGVPGLPQDTLAGFGVQDTMDEFAKVHRGIAPYVFMLDDNGSITNDTECVDSSRGHVETYLTKDVPNYIKSHFDVAANSSSWAIGGLSMGGMCGAMLTLRHPETYRYFLDYGGEAGPEVGSQNKTIDAIFGGSKSSWEDHQITQLLSKHKYNNIGGYFVSARGDNILLINSIHDNYNQAKNSGVEAIYESINGEHTFKVWQQAYKDSIPWLANRLGATICSLSCK